MENITCELNGIKYLLVEMLLTSDSKDRVMKKAKKYEAIFQGVSQIKSGGFLTSGHAIIKVLVPEKNVIMWNEDEVDAIR